MRIGLSISRIRRILIVREMRVLLCIVLGLASHSLWAADLKPLFSLSHARVLPTGVRQLSYKNMLLSANQKFGDSGRSLVLADPFFKRITFNDILLGTKEPTDRGSLEQVILSMGADGNDAFGSTTGQVNINSSVHVPILAWGISKKLTLAVAVPILQASINVDSGVVQENAALHTSFIQTLHKKGVTEKIVEFQEKMRDPVRSKLRDYGYRELLSEKVTWLGDIKLISKYQILNNPKSRLSVQGELTLPSGEEKDVDKIVNVTLGDGQTDVGLGINYDYVLFPSVTIALGTSYTLQLSDRSRERVPEQYDSKVTPDIDPNLGRDLGNIFATQIGGIYAHQGWSLQLGHSYQYKGADRYSGIRFPAVRYEWMSRETEQKMHALVMGGGFNTIELFKAKRFPVPLSIALNHTRVLAGKNVVKNPLTSLDISLFF